MASSLRLWVRSRPLESWLKGWIQGGVLSSNWRVTLVFNPCRERVHSFSAWSSIQPELDHLVGLDSLKYTDNMGFIQKTYLHNERNETFAKRKPTLQKPHGKNVVCQRNSVVAISATRKDCQVSQWGSRRRGEALHLKGLVYGRAMAKMLLYWSMTKLL